MKPKLTILKLQKEAAIFCKTESVFENSDLFGVTDGKAVGTFVEHKFKHQLAEKYDFVDGSSANGIDLPGTEILTDIKVTSIKQPQSSCPFKDAKQKIFGLGYNLLLFVYDKVDNPNNKTSKLNFVNCTFISKERTADYTTTFRLKQMVEDKANAQDIAAYLTDRNIPADETTVMQIAESVLNNPPQLGYLTVSNALQWRLQYQRIVSLTDSVSGICKIADNIN